MGKTTDLGATGGTVAHRSKDDAWATHAKDAKIDVSSTQLSGFVRLGTLPSIMSEPTLSTISRGAGRVGGRVEIALACGRERVLECAVRWPTGKDSELQRADATCEIT
jgi:hypothetical protein